MEKLIKYLFVFILITSLGLIIWNLDVVIRANRNIQNGTFSIQRLRYEIAAFNIGYESQVTPIDSKQADKDGMTQLLVPAGEFLMGKEGEPDEDSPIHEVYLNAYWIDKVEVTNSMYAKCVAEDACALPTIRLNTYYGNWIYRDHPVVYVSWFRADEYCQWAGRRLPTEAEWEKAARGTEKNKYPWGDASPNPRLVNFADSLIGESVSAYRYPLGASPYGALNMVGNVREWIADWFSITYYRESPAENPMGPQDGKERSLRSGAYDANANEIFTTSRYKHEPNSAGLSRGFRCAESATP
jgi:formylglycine-generating enzyme required for sulfatase activity